jgi:MinD superfamily P-loop ATPase
VYRFRLFLAWLIMAAIPLQGLAAASMLFCATGEHHAAAQVTAAIDQHDHSKHGHADEVPSKQAVDESGKKLPDLTHKCSVCASCCSSVALTESPQLVAFAPVPQAELAEPFVLIHARPAQVPDKPPRA